MSAITIPAPQTPAVTPPPVGQAAPTPQVGGWRKHRWTIAEYRELYKTGLFNDVKTILLDGEVYVMPMPHPLHDGGLTLAFRYALKACPADHYVRNQQGFDVGTDNDPGPDLAIVPGDYQDYLAHAPSKAALIIEVSYSTLATDTTTKAEQYATAGVPEYWVLDVEGRRLLVFRDPEPLPKGLGATAYRTHSAHGPDDTVAPLAAPNAAITVADLLP
jgi:Uma2 family endonuclease